MCQVNGPDYSVRCDDCGCSIMYSERYDHKCKQEEPMQAEKKSIYEDPKAGEKMAAMRSDPYEKAAREFLDAYHSPGTTVTDVELRCTKQALKAAAPFMPFSDEQKRELLEDFSGSFLENFHSANRIPRSMMEVLTEVRKEFLAPKPRYTLTDEYLLDSLRIINLDGKPHSAALKINAEAECARLNAQDRGEK